MIDVAPTATCARRWKRSKPLNYLQSERQPARRARALLFEATHSRSLLALPLIGRGQTLGLVLFADTLHARAFTPREIDLGRAIVGQAATALENVGLVRDLEASLRELKETQNRLVQGARLSAMGELAAAVAHQINNPLTTIVLDTELLLEHETHRRTQALRSARTPFRAPANGRRESCGACWRWRVRFRRIRRARRLT